MAHARGDVARVVAVVVNSGLFVGGRGWHAGVPRKEHVVTRAADGEVPSIGLARGARRAAHPALRGGALAAWILPVGRHPGDEQLIHLPEPFAATVLLQTRPPPSPWTDTLVRPGAVISDY